MIKELIHDPIFLVKKSEDATKEDLQVAQDLLDTLMAHKDSCVGMAANMIGVRKRIIVFLDESGRVPTYTVMLNPEIVKKDGAYNTEESCLSLLGGLRPCKRYKSIKVRYQTMEMQTRIKTFTGWPAQIIQHEVDHCDGILI
ncbi:MAG: peptide deformylase [Ruminococcaceae bacterium]|nr:peptide deformylase [Oscillospiraceae bacterium]